MKLHPLESTSPVIVYIDFKSPYAYLAVEPTRQLEREMGINFDWRPFVLDIPSYLGSASLDQAGNVADQSRSAEQWAAVKYAYYDCRRYATIGDLTIRGTVKIWDTNLVAAAMLWLRDQAPSKVGAFIDLVYQPFWRRELTIDDPAAIGEIIEKCGLAASDFMQWHANGGDEFNKRFQREAFELGVYGVPTYVVDDELYFGREHLPRVGWHLNNQSIPAPDIAYSISNNSIKSPHARPTSIAIGVDDSLDSLLAIPRLVELLSSQEVRATWYRAKPPAMDDLIPQDDNNARGERHRELRNLTRSRNNQRYASHINPKDAPQKIEVELSRLEINIEQPPAEVEPNSPMPGICVHLDQELFIGRQHLPLIKALLSTPS